MQKKKLPQTGNIGLLMETSWEVCNKIGGIYTVLSTKARVLQEKYSDRLVFIGPDVWTENNPSPYFTERKTILKSASSKLNLPFGISIRTGKWNIPGSPQVVLVKFEGVYNELNSIFSTMWEKFGVDSMHEYGDYREGCAFSIAASIVMDALADHLKADGKSVVCHYNEWTTGMGLLYTKLNRPDFATVFTTHATSIGRSICGNGKPLYDFFNGYDGDQMARELNMEAKHSLEKTAAHQADCFTAVSEITAKECEQLLGIRPQVVTPNGFEPDFVPGTAEYNKKRAIGRRKILGIAAALRGSKFPEDTVIVATSGRNEYRNKGIDLFLDSLATLEFLDTPKKVLALILVPAWSKSPSGFLQELLNVGETVCSGPDYLTHRLYNEDSDSITRRIASLEEEGKLKGRVNVVYVPCYLDGNDGIVNISYYDILPAIDLTVFPSYYEPWGYTPLESVAFGTPTVTTDKSGFGQWVLSHCGNGLEECGVRVIPRSDSSYGLSASEIAVQIQEFAGADNKGIEKSRKAAISTSKKADWKFFISAYDEAFSIATRRRDERAI